MSKLIGRERSQEGMMSRRREQRTVMPWRQRFSDHIPLLSLIVLCLSFSVASDAFLTVRNLVNVIDQLTVLTILAIGMTGVIVIGGIDLSVGSVLALSMMVMGALTNLHGIPLPLGVVAGLVVGTACGTCSGLLVTRGHLPAFIATLAMMSVARGLANLITDGSQIVGYPEWFSALSIRRHFGFLSATVAIVVVLTVLAGIYLKYRAGGRALYAIGGNREVARLAGIRVASITVGVYAVSGFLAALAGVVMSTRLDSSQPSGGLGYELDAIAAVVIGGASLTGGVGSIWGTVMGVLTIGVLRNGLNLLGTSPFVQQVVIGAVIVLAVMTDGKRRELY
jgi:ribose transport system permease protein